MTMAWKQEYIQSNPADTRRLEIAKIVTPEVEAFSNEEIAEILKMAQLEPIHITPSALLPFTQEQDGARSPA